MTHYDSQKHHRRSIRLKGYDYSQPGAYFVTIVAWQRECLFGEIVGGVMRLNEFGKIVHAEWNQLSRHFPNIRLDVFVVMPNHVHGIIVIEPEPARVRATHPSLMDTRCDENPGPEQARVSVDGSPLPTGSDSAREGEDGSPPLPHNGPPPGSLGAMIGQFKSRATKRIWALSGVNRYPIWQRNYFEHIIRNDREFENIWNYIDTNPLRWEADQLRPSSPQDAFRQQ